VLRSGHSERTADLQHDREQVHAFEMLDLPADPGLSVLIYSAEPASESERALDELLRWGATRARLTAVEAETPG
jgi:hypothetical protein